MERATRDRCARLAARHLRAHRHLLAQPGLVGGSFSVDVNLTDGAAHRVALYLLDWDNNARAIRIDVLDAATQQVLSTQNVQSFSSGVYLVWDLRGHVILRFTSTGGTNAVLSGLFFDPKP